MGIEPTTSAWKAEVLPLNYTRIDLVIYFVIFKTLYALNLEMLTFLSPLRFKRTRIIIRRSVKNVNGFRQKIFYPSA